MREILFRGKCKDNGAWVYGFFTGQAILTYYDNKYKMLTYIAPDTHAIIYKHKVIPETVGQYTGLTDKNGKRIFEGDKIKSGSGRAWYSIVFEDGGYGLRPLGKGNKSIPIMGHWNFKANEHEVIGNIHDNPELMEA